MESTKKLLFSSSFGFFGSFILSACAGFVLSGMNMAGVSSFADISLAGGLSLPSATAVLTGSLIRCIIGGSIGKNIIRISSLLIIVITKMFLEPKNEPKLCGISSAAAVFLSGAAVTALIGDILYKLLFYVFYAALTGFASYSVSLILTGIKQKKAVDLRFPYGCAFAVVYTLAAAALCSIQLPFINIGIVFGTAVTLSGAYFYRHNGGVLCGALTTCGAFLAAPDCGMTVVLLPAAGLLTGYLWQKRINAAAGFFVLLNFMLISLSGINMNTVGSMIDLLLGTGAFLLAAPYYSDKLIITEKDNISALPEILGARMNFLADSIGSVRIEAEKIAKVLSEKNEDTASDFEKTNDICSRCFRHSVCWKSEKEATMRGFTKLSEQCETSAEAFPYELERCLRKKELRDFFDKNSHERAAMKLVKMRYSESRRLLSEQIKAIEGIISSSGEKVDVRYSFPLSRTIREKLENYGFSPKKAIACYNSHNRLLAEIYFSAENAPDNCRRICDLISDELRIPLEIAEPVRSISEIRLRIFEKPEHSLQVYAAAVCAQGGNENGDSSVTFTDGTGRSYIVLSDGMGNGKNAAVQSRLVIRMFRKLITSGADYDSAIRLINSIMLTKSGDETFATLDAVRIDLDTCELTVIKSGAAATIIRHGNDVIKISQPTFPIGIYERSEAFTKNCDFESGDIIIMFSDGISENEYLFIRELLTGSSDLKYIVDEICRKSELFSPNSHSDDVTVIGIHII